VWALEPCWRLSASSSIGLLIAVGRHAGAPPAWAWRLAVIGCAVFCLQTVIFDAVIWSAYFNP
jgi:hypothetical protein